MDNLNPKPNSPTSRLMGIDIQISNSNRNNRSPKKQGMAMQNMCVGTTGRGMCLEGSYFFLMWWFWCFLFLGFFFGGGVSCGSARYKVMYLEWSPLLPDLSNKLHTSLGAPTVPKAGDQRSLCSHKMLPQCHVWLSQKLCFCSISTSNRPTICALALAIECHESARTMSSCTFYKVTLMAALN